MACRAVPEKDRKAVGPRTVEKSCKWIFYCFVWACGRNAAGGGKLLDPGDNPLTDGQFRKAIPSEANPRRPTMTTARYERLREHTDSVTMELRHHGKRESVRSYLSELVDLAWATGRRISAICRLQYADLHMERSEAAPFGSITWRAANDKAGKQTTVAINALARRALDRVMKDRPGVGTAWLFPAPGKPDKPVSQHLATRWLAKAEEAGELETLEGGAWHPFRRAWATARKGMPVKDVARAGGWSTEHPDMVTQVYQQADDDATLAVVLGGGKVREVAR